MMPTESNPLQSNTTQVNFASQSEGLSSHTLPHNDDELSPPLPSIPSEPIRYALSFTGTGSEYFKIWIVNLLLILVTFGIFYPWAKVRKAKYLHRNMMLDGAAFDYHASGGTILKGTLIAAALYGVYHLVESSRSWLIFIAFTVAMCVALPWLLWKSMRFKLSVTSYRALPFSFKASLKESFNVFVPIVLYNAAIVAVFFYLADEKLSNAKVPEVQLKAVGFAFALFALLIVLFYPLFYFLLKRYQHNNYQWTSLRTQFLATITSVYREWMLIIIPFIGFYGVVGLTVYIYVSAAGAAGLLNKAGGLVIAVLIVAFITTYIITLLVPLIFKALFVSRFQNLVWNSTSAQGIKFVSTLKARSLIWQSVKNLFFIAITFGIYWPFAFINIVKLRAASISIIAAAPLIHLAAQHAAAYKERNAVGDAAGDLFDIDIAL